MLTCFGDISKTLNGLKHELEVKPKECKENTVCVPKSDTPNRNVSNLSSARNTMVQFYQNKIQDMKLALFLFPRPAC